MSSMPPSVMFKLRAACGPYADNLPGTPYLVGSQVDGTAGPMSDYDIRQIIPDDEYIALTSLIGSNGLIVLGFAVSADLSAKTGLKVDFQFQRQSTANESKKLTARNPMTPIPVIHYAGMGM